MANVTFTLLESKTMMMLMMMMMMIRTEKLCSEDIEDLTLVFISYEIYEMSPRRVS